MFRVTDVLISGIKPISTITTIAGSDQPKNSRAVINTNFSNLNSDKVEGTSGTLTTPTINGAIAGTCYPPMTFYSANFNAPEGFLLNGKIVPSVGSNNLTVAIKGMDGNDPSASNPVYCRINGVVRAITAALAVTTNAGTNWFNSGGSELATKEIDYFVYLGYNATDGVVVGFARLAAGNSYDDFSTTNTNERFCAISTITNAAATDYYHVIGRFAATLSAGAGYTWTVPTFTAKNLVQRPIYETRKLNWLMAQTGWSATPSGLTGTYQLFGERLFINPIVVSGTSTAATATLTLPFTVTPGDNMVQTAYVVDNSVGLATSGRVYIGNNSNSLVIGKALNADGGFTASGTKSMYTQCIVTTI